jgi:hypothetical protein
MSTLMTPDLFGKGLQDCSGQADRIIPASAAPIRLNLENCVNRLFWNLLVKF